MKTANKRIGVENLRTLRSSVTKFRTRSAQAALIELARLAQEKERLLREMERCQDQIHHVEARLKEIPRIEAWLNNFVENPNGFGVTERNGTLRKSEKSSDVLMNLKEMTIRY